MQNIRQTYAARRGRIRAVRRCYALDQTARKTTEAQRRASLKWEQANNEKVTIKLRKGADPGKDQIRAAAERDGMSVNAWIIEAIRDKL